MSYPRTRSGSDQAKVGDRSLLEVVAGKPGVDDLLDRRLAARADGQARQGVAHETFVNVVTAQQVEQRVVRLHDPLHVVRRQLALAEDDDDLSGVPAADTGQPVGVDPVTVDGDVDRLEQAELQAQLDNQLGESGEPVVEA